MKITPILIVEEIEKSLPFWIDRMGFAKAVEVPEGDRLGFVILAWDSAELMLQTYDVIVAATALERGRSVATFNEQHFCQGQGIERYRT